MNNWDEIRDKLNAHFNFSLSSVNFFLNFNLVELWRENVSSSGNVARIDEISHRLEINHNTSWAQLEKFPEVRGWFWLNQRAMLRFVVDGKWNNWKWNIWGSELQDLNSLNQINYLTFCYKFQPGKTWEKRLQKSFYNQISFPELAEIFSPGYLFIHFKYQTLWKWISLKMYSLYNSRSFLN